MLKSSGKWKPTIASSERQNLYFNYIGKNEKKKNTNKTFPDDLFIGIGHMLTIIIFYLGLLIYENEIEKGNKILIQDSQANCR